MSDRPTPKIVHQVTPVVCFAAALESWLDACSKERFRTQIQILEEDKKRIIFGMEIAELRNYAAQKGMTTEWVTLDKFDFEYVRKKLEISVLFVGHKASDVIADWWHCGVVYGIAKTRRGPTGLKVMDPGMTAEDTRKGGVVGLAEWELKDLFPKGPATELLVGWRANGPGVLIP